MYLKPPYWGMTKLLKLGWKEFGMVFSPTITVKYRSETVLPAYCDTVGTREIIVTIS